MKMSRMHLGGTLAATICLLAAFLTWAPPAQAAVFVPDTPTQGWGVDGRVYAITVVGDRVYVGGDFDRAINAQGASVARVNLAAFDLNTGALITTWRADTDARVYTLASAGDQLYVGGAFGRVNGATRQRIAAVSLATGALNTAFAPRPTALVRAIQPAGGALYIGGQFTSVNGVAAQRVARIDRFNGAVDTSFRASANSEVMALVWDQSRSRLYVAGGFTNLSGSSRAGVGAVNDSTGAITGPSFAGSVVPTRVLTLNEDGSVLFGGSGNWNNDTAAWTANTGVRRWHMRVGGDVQSIGYYAGDLYIGFHDEYGGDTSLKLLALDPATGAVDPDFRPRFNQFWGVEAISVGSYGLVVGGDFTFVSGVWARYWTRFLPSGTQPPPPPPPPPPSDTQIVVTDNAAWRWYYDGAPPSNWNQPGFDSSAWASGNATLGFGDPSVSTNINHYSSAAARPLAAYFSHRVNVADIGSVTSMTLTTVANDGVVVYVNGTEVGRWNMPSGPVTAGTYALPPSGGGPVTVTIPRQLLVEGTNVIAAETHLNYHATPNIAFYLRAVVGRG